MNSRRLAVALNILFAHSIFAQLYLPQKNVGQNGPTNPALSNVNNLPVVNNLPAANNLQLLNSLPADNNSLVNRLQILTGLPFSNGLGNDIPSNNALLQRNILRIGSELPANNNVPINNLPAFNNIPGNNILANSNLPTCSLPVTNNLPNLQVNNYPSTPNIPVVDLPFGNTINGLANSGILSTNPAVFNNGGQLTNGMSNLQSFNNVLNNAPKVTRSMLPNGILPKTGLPVLNANLLNSLLENHVVMNSKQTPEQINNDLQFASFLANNVAENHVFPTGWPGSDGLLNPQITNVPANLPVNVPASVPISNNILAPGIPTNGPLSAMAVNNINKMQAAYAQQATNNLQPQLNNILQLGNVPMNNLDICDRNFNSGQLLTPNLPVANVMSNNLPVNNFISNLPGDNLLGNNLPVNNLIGNGPANNIGRYLPVGSNLNVPGSLSSLNLLNLGELGNLPILSGLPVIGISETVTVINTAPSLIL